MDKETVRLVKENIYRNAIQLNTVTKERTNEKGLRNHRRKTNERGKKGGGEEREKEVETSRSQCN